MQSQPPGSERSAELSCGAPALVEARRREDVSPLCKESVSDILHLGLHGLHEDAGGGRCDGQRRGTKWHNTVKHGRADPRRACVLRSICLLRACVVALSVKTATLCAAPTDLVASAAVGT